MVKDEIVVAVAACRDINISARMVYMHNIINDIASSFWILLLLLFSLLLLLVTVVSIVGVHINVSWFLTG
jgi:hypothetical protein